MKDVVESCLTKWEHSGDSFRAEFRFPPELDVFRGHFPGAPLVPGIFLIEAARIAAERAAGHGLRITRVKDAKFVQMVKPDDLVEVTGQIRAQRCSTTLSGGTRVELDLAAIDC